MENDYVASCASANIVGTIDQNLSFSKDLNNVRLTWSAAVLYIFNSPRSGMRYESL
jgi:hypothetical protein